MKPGSIGWVDLTVHDAEGIRDFYQSVVGWTPHSVDMGEYNDYSMAPEEGGPVAGICHAKGENAELPPTWLIYIIVPDLDASLERCRQLGGKVLTQPRTMGKAKFCAIEDPSGAPCALYQPE